MDIGAALTIVLLAALLGQAWAMRIRLGAAGNIPVSRPTGNAKHPNAASCGVFQANWLVAALMLNAMSLPAAMLLLGDAREGLGVLAGFGAVLVASAAAIGSLIWLRRMERLQATERLPERDG